MPPVRNKQQKHKDNKNCNEIIHDGCTGADDYCRNLCFVS